MTRLLVLLILLLPVPALAQERFPALYDVVGVATDDVLNVRAGPSASEPIIGTLAPDARNIEIVARPDGNWGRVNTGERAGWASMRYLARQPGQGWGMIPAALACFGTEPFWSLDITAGNTGFFATPEVTTPLTVTDRVAGVARPDRFAIMAEGSEGDVTAIVSYEACNDGMSDRLYGMALDVLMEPGVLYSGCCSLAR